MPEHNPHPHRLPTWGEWSTRFTTTIAALQRAATRYKRLTLAEAPADLNAPHVDYMLRPPVVQALAHAVEELAEGLYAIETHARYRRHRPAAQVDLNAARKHLQQAARALNMLTTRGRTE